MIKIPFSSQSCVIRVMHYLEKLFELLINKPSTYQGKHNETIDIPSSCNHYDNSGNIISTQAVATS